MILNNGTKHTHKLQNSPSFIEETKCYFLAHICSILTFIFSEFLLMFKPPVLRRGLARETLSPLSPLLSKILSPNFLCCQRIYKPIRIVFCAVILITLGGNTKASFYAFTRNDQLRRSGVRAADFQYFQVGFSVPIRSFQTFWNTK